VSLLVVFIIGVYFAMDYATNKILRAISLDEGTMQEQEVIVPIETMAGSPTPKAASNPKSDEVLQPSPTKYDASVSISKASNVKKSISLKDKTEISRILLKRLSSSNITLLTKLASGGLTSIKKLETKKVILQKLSEDEYNELIQIAAKLGLCKGKSYQDSV